MNSIESSEDDVYQQLVEAAQQAADLTVAYFQLRCQDWSHVTVLNLTHSKEVSPDTSSCFQSVQASVATMRLITLMTEIKSLTIKNYRDKIDALPAQIYRLTKLEDLDVSGNMLYTLQSTLRSCKMLRYIDISDQHDFMRVPLFIHHLPKLQSWKNEDLYKVSDYQSMQVHVKPSAVYTRLPCTVTNEGLKFYSPLPDLKLLAGEALLRTGVTQMPGIPKHLEEYVFEYWLDNEYLVTCDNCGRRRRRQRPHPWYNIQCNLQHYNIPYHYSARLEGDACCEKCGKAVIKGLDKSRVITEFPEDRERLDRLRRPRKKKCEEVL